MLRIRAAAGLALLLFIAGPLCAASWKAGVATINITPEQPIWMAGYASRDRPAQGTGIELWAKALALQDADGRRRVLVTMDLLGIPRDLSLRICRRLETEYKLSRPDVVLSTTHTHSGPVVGKNLRPAYPLDAQRAKKIYDYTRRLEDEIVQVVGEALAKLAPARLAWGVGQATFAVNRRNNAEADVPKLRAEGKLRGPVDHDLPVLAVHDRENRLLAVVCGYACHATTLAGYQWSGDWPGYAALQLEKQNPGAVAMIWLGCGGDQNPLPRRKVELAQQYGRRLAQAAQSVLDSDMRPVGDRLRSSYDEITLKFAQVPTRAELESAQKSSNRYEAARAKLLLARWDRDGEPLADYPYPVQVWRFEDGPLWIVLGGEVVVDYSLRLKQELGAATTWVAAYSNDVMAYIPSRRVLREGGYEGGGSMVYYGLPSPWRPEIEEQIVEEVHRQAEK